jgi:predicted metal-binding protein
MASTKLSTVIARSVSDEAIHFAVCGTMDCFAEPVIGRRFAPTRWLAMTETTIRPAVIARSASDEAIHFSACGAMDCFAALAMTGAQAA